MTAKPAGIEPPKPTRLGEVAWLQPYPDVLLEDLPDAAPGPDVVLESREATSLAFVTALQLLPPRQRAVLILRDVLGFRASEVAAMLDATQESVTSALKRGRAALASNQDSAGDRVPAPAPGSAAEREVVDRFVAAFAAKDVDAIVALLTQDAWVRMPRRPVLVRPDVTRGSQAIVRTAPCTGGVMRYVLFVSNDETAAVGSEERSRREAAFGWFVDEMRRRGTPLIGERMQPSETATSVRCWEGGDVIISAGSNRLPTEQVSAVFLVDCAGLDEAVGFATTIPAAWYGTVEVRPTRAEDPARAEEPARVVHATAV